MKRRVARTSWCLSVLLHLGDRSRSTALRLGYYNERRQIDGAFGGNNVPFIPGKQSGGFVGLAWSACNTCRATGPCRIGFVDILSCAYNGAAWPASRPEAAPWKSRAGTTAFQTRVLL